MLSLPLSSFPRPNFVFSRRVRPYLFLSEEDQKNNVILSYVVKMLSSPLSSFPFPNYVLSRECAVLLLTSEELHMIMLGYLML